MNFGAYGSINDDQLMSILVRNDEKLVNDASECYWFLVFHTWRSMLITREIVWKSPIHG